MVKYPSIVAANYADFVSRVKGMFRNFTIVPGYGNPHANVSIVGLQAVAGEHAPFRKPPNFRVLDAIGGTLGVRPEACFTTYMLKDASLNRTDPETLKLWGHVLGQELALIKSRAIVFLGRDVFKWFTGVDNEIESLRHVRFGYPHDESVNIFVTYSPEDLEDVDGEPSPLQRGFIEDLSAVFRVQADHFTKEVELPMVDGVPHLLPNGKLRIVSEG